MFPQYLVQWASGGYLGWITARPTDLLGYSQSWLSYPSACAFLGCLISLYASWKPCY